MITGLIFNCPFNEEEYDCPFSEIRKKPIMERLKCFNSLNITESNKMLIKHSNCLRKRESK